jgi:hypothetical protein
VVVVVPVVAEVNVVAEVDVVVVGVFVSVTSSVSMREKRVKSKLNQKYE